MADTITIPNRSEFASDEEYKNALIGVYQDMRETEYDWTVYNESMKVYNCSKDACSCGKGVENTYIWNGYSALYSQNPNLRDQVDNCAISLIPEMAGMTFNGNPNSRIRGSAGLHSCAISASALETQIFNKMGYTGEDNIINVTKQRNLATGEGNIVSARGFARTESVRDSIAYVRNVYPELMRTESPKNRTLRDKIKAGEIGVGDAVSLSTSNASNTSSGAHAMVVADIQYDENGNVSTFTMQASNRAHFETYSINSTKYYATCTVLDVVPASSVMQGKINDEVTSLGTKSIEEIEQEITNVQGRLTELSTEIEQTENHYIESGHGLAESGALGRHGKLEIVDNRTQVVENDQLKVFSELFDNNPELREAMNRFNARVDELVIEAAPVEAASNSSDEATPVVEASSDELQVEATSVVDEATPVVDASVEATSVVDEATPVVEASSDELQVEATSVVDEATPVVDAPVEATKAVVTSSYHQPVEETLVLPSNPQVHFEEKVNASNLVNAEQLAVSNTLSDVKLKKMKGWFDKVGLDETKMNDMIALYGGDYAYKLALDAMLKPDNLCDDLDISMLSSKKTIEYLINNEINSNCLASALGVSKNEVEQTLACQPGAYSRRQEHFAEIIDVRTNNISNVSQGLSGTGHLLNQRLALRQGRDMA